MKVRDPFAKNRLEKVLRLLTKMTKHFFFFFFFFVLLLGLSAKGGEGLICCQGRILFLFLAFSLNKIVPGFAIDQFFFVVAHRLQLEDKSKRMHFHLFNEFF